MASSRVLSSLNQRFFRPSYAVSCAFHTLLLLYWFTCVKLMLVCDVRQRIVAERCLVLVYAIEATEMAQQAKKIVQSNGMQDRITVVHGRVEVSVHQLSTSHT